MPRTKNSTKPTVIELVKMKVYENIGIAPTNIAKRLGKSHHTVIKYLGMPEVFEDVKVKKLIAKYTQKEIDDLTSINTKARLRLHEILDEGNTKAIETTAIMDRTFQQRQILTGNATEIVDIRDDMRALVSLEERIRQELEKRGVVDVVDISPDVPHTEK